MQQLIDGGRPLYGIFDEAVENINYGEYRYLRPSGREFGRLRRHFGCNSFQFMGAVSETVIFGCAIVDIRVLNASFGYFFFPDTGEFFPYSQKRPLSLGLRFEPFPENGRAEFAGGRVCMEAEGGERRLMATYAPDAVFAAEFFEKKCQPMRICTRAGWGGWVFARKTAGIPVAGKLVTPRGPVELKGALGHTDWSMGFMRRETFWNWACLNGRLPGGRTLGLNISCGVNETSFTENCLWLGGKQHRLGLASFEYDLEQPDRPWRIRTGDGNADLEFQMLNVHEEHTDALVVASHFHQFVGRFYGTIRVGREKLKVDGMYGFAEDHYAKW